MLRFHPQTMAISDYVFPLVKATILNGNYRYEELIGTGFFIGNGGYALTAGHVVDQLFNDLKSDGVVLALFQTGQIWYAYKVIDSEIHPFEDIGLIKLEGSWWKSIVVISSDYHNSSAEYTCWGYPKIVAQEVQRIVEGAAENPELIYTQGYIRRRISRELEVSIYRGKQFYELSEIVGEGNSGGPVILKKSIGQNKWEVIGVYIGEKASSGVDVSYAVRSDGFFNWTPTMLSTTIIKFVNS
jgi:hypothetical protein